MKKLLVLAAVAVGYVLGTRAGRERYEQIMEAFGKVKDDPRVQEKAHQAVDAAKQKAPVVADKVSEVASSAKSKLTSGGSGQSGSAGKDEIEERLEQVRSSGPQGDLP